MIKHTIQEIIHWITIFFSPGESHTKGMLFLLHLSLQGVTEVDTDPKGRFVLFRGTAFNEGFACAPSGYRTREQLAKGYFFEGLQNYMQTKNKWNEIKIMLGDLNCSMDKINRDGENKTKILYRCCSNYALSKLIVENSLEDLWRRENPDSLSSTATIRPLPRIQDRQGLYWYKKLLKMPRLIT